MFDENIINTQNNEKEEIRSISEVSKKNAQSAYFMIFISLMFLFNKHNPHLNNDFVKSHTKTAFFIHILLLIIYIVFIHYSLLSNFSIL
jgi:hypothetical protein